jgi:hypothetical protein
VMTIPFVDREYLWCVWGMTTGTGLEKIVYFSFSFFNKTCLSGLIFL